MQELKRLPAKTWRVARDSITGQIYTGDYGSIYGKHDMVAKLIDKAKQKRAATGLRTPVGWAPGSAFNATTREYDYPDYKGPCLSDVERYDYIPVLRVTLQFRSIYNGTSGAALNFMDQTGHNMLLRSNCSDRFFHLVAAGKIQMDSAGFYTFDVYFTKAGEKVYMELYGYDE